MHVYILTNKKNGVLYVGVTNDIERRIAEHKQKIYRGFSSRYNLRKLVYFERFDDPTSAIAREKQLKGWLRVKKIRLIETDNPEWRDLSEGWYER
jgi:putative endonuclease